MPAYQKLSDSFALAQKRGYNPADGPVFLVGGVVSKWPQPGSLYSEVCAGFAGLPRGDQPPACAAAL